MWRSKEVFDAEVTAHEGDSDGHAFEDGPTQLVVIFLFFMLVQEGKFRLVFIDINDGLHRLFLIDDQRLLQALPFLLLTTLTLLISLTSLTALTPFASITGHFLYYLPLILPSQGSPFFLSHQA